MIRRLKIFVIILISVSLLHFPAIAESNPSMENLYNISGSIGGPTNAVAVNGSYVYVGKGCSIIILKNEGGRLIQTGKTLNLPSYVSDIKIDNELLYIAAGSAGLYIVDIAKPAEPVSKGVYASPGFAEAVAVKDGKAYLANGSQGLDIIDVTNSAKPALLGQTFEGKYAFGVALAGNYAYIAAADDGLLVTDITHADSPSGISSVDTPGIARHVSVSGRYAYVADDWKGVCVLDIGNPAKPLVKKSISTAGRAYGLALDSHYMYVADAYMGLRVFDVADISAPKDIFSYIPDNSQLLRVTAWNGLVFCADRTNGITMFDAANPAELKMKSFYSHTLPTPLYIPGELRYWDNNKEISRLLFLGIISENNIRPDDEMTRAEFAELLCRALKADTGQKPKKSVFTDVPVSHGSYVFMEKAVGMGLMLNKSKNRFDPNGRLTYGEVVISLLKAVNKAPKDGSTQQSYINEAQKLGLEAMVSRDNIDQTMKRANIMAMLSKVIVEVSDGKTKSTILQGKYGIELQATPMEVVDVAVKGNYAYLVSAQAGMSVVDICDSGDLRQVAHIDLPLNVQYIRIKGSYAYIFSGNTLYTVDISDPLHPVCVNVQYNGSGGVVRGISFESDRMYIADEWGIKIFSLKDPGRPVCLKFHKLLKEGFGNVSCTSDIAVRNGIAYVAFESDGLQIYDVSDAEHIKPLNSYKSDWTCNIQFQGSYAYARVSSDRVEILDISDIKNPRLSGSIENANSSQFNYKIGFYGDVALLPNDTKGIMFADISSPSSPKPLGYTDLVGIPVNVLVEGKRAFVANGIGGLYVLDFSGTLDKAVNDNAAGKSLSGVSGNFSISAFKGLAAEKYALTGEKAEAVLKAQKTLITETLTVTNTNSDGKGSLNWCVMNIKQGGRIVFDTVVFNPEKPATIYPAETLALNRVNSVTIDGSNAGVIIDGSRVKSAGSCMDISTDSNVIKGLKIQNFKDNAIMVNGKNNIIGGSRQKGKSANGEGNVFINNGIVVYLSGVTVSDNIIVGNNIGVDADGMTSGGNEEGVFIREKASRNIIGIDKPEYRNIVGNCKNNGISSMGNCFGNLIEGNYVGTDITGTKAMGNFSHGITFELCGYGSIVRNNVCCSNGRFGIQIYDNSSAFNVVVGNSSGIGADGKTELANYVRSIFTGSFASFNVIGGKKDNLKNRIFDLDNEGMSIGGTYDIIVDGDVYKYSTNDRY